MDIFYCPSQLLIRLNVSCLEFILKQVAYSAVFLVEIFYITSANFLNKLGNDYFRMLTDKEVIVVRHNTICSDLKTIRGQEPSWFSFLGCQMGKYSFSQEKKKNLYVFIVSKNNLLIVASVIDVITIACSKVFIITIIAMSHVWHGTPKKIKKI